jgi:hypothetical protein
MTVDKQTDAGPDSGDIETAADQREQAADEREQAADEREGALDVREYQVMARVEAESERASRVQKILSAADERAMSRPRLVTVCPSSATWPPTSMPG